MRASLEVADIFCAAGPAYRMAHAGHLSLHQLKIMSAIEHCRTAALGGHVEACTNCLHALPRGFHRIRHYGLLASARRKAHLERARRLLNVAPAPADDPPAELEAQPLCPCCGGTMVIIEVFERRYQPRAPPPPSLSSGTQAP